MKQLKDLKIALVHDFLLYPGGAEKVLKVLSEIFPEAPIYTLLYNPEKMEGLFKGKEIKTSYLQRLPKFFRHHHQWLLPLLPSAPETLDLREYDLVISSSGAWMKGIVTKLNTVHIAYLHSPMRFVWDYRDKYLAEDRKMGQGIIARLFLSYLRLWDFEAAQRPDYLIANSQYTQERIRKYYRRESVVIYPPAANCHSERSVSEAEESNSDNIRSLDFAKDDTPSQRYFLIVSRLSPYKKVGLVVEAFNKLGLPLVVIGEGRQKKGLKKIANKNVRILGWQSEAKLASYYSGARAFIFPAEDDFGITAVEAMSYGLPLIALEKGGVREIAGEKEAVEFFSSQTVEVLADGVRNFIRREKEFDREKIMKQAQKFSAEQFKTELLKFVEAKIKL